MSMDSTEPSLNSRQEWHRATVRALDGKSVLVRPEKSDEHPVVGMRGTLHVNAALEVEIVIDFPVMFDRPAARKTIRLDESQVLQLLASENAGAYTITLPGPIEAPPTVGYVVASPRL